MTIRYQLTIVSMAELGEMMKRARATHGDPVAIPMYAAFPDYESPPQTYPGFLPEGWSFGYDWERKEAWLDDPSGHLSQ